MYVKQLYTSCLSEAAYFIESDGEAAVIDPLRDVDSYIELAKEKGASIKYVFETHFHADFVSGHLDLGKETGAPIIYGPGTETKYPVYVAKDHEIFKIGKITIEVMHTPGHTLESSCFLLRDEQGNAHCIFTGDTLFVGDVGRPDLSSGDLSSEDLAGIMYDSLQTKILPLADNVIVYPAHGPGSSCGKSLGPETQSTIGKEKETNYALQPQTREEFITAVTTGLKSAPVYFPINARINKEGYTSLSDLRLKALVPLNVTEFKSRLNDDTVVVDTRNVSAFTSGFIPGSIFVGLEGRFAEWAATVLPFDKYMLLVTDKGMEEETFIRLARVGLDKVIGYLDGGFESWISSGENIDLIIDIEPDELVMDILHDPNAIVLDVRREAEFAGGHVTNAVNLPLSEMIDVAQIANFEENQNLYIHCAGGYRSVIAASLLKRQGYHNLRNVLGGWAKMKDEPKLQIEKDVSVLN